MDFGGTKGSLRQGRVWAITSYFPFDDPAGVKRRLGVYREFRRNLQIPLLTIELSQRGEFDLTPADAEILLQVRGGALLWQKERLLNRALEALPDDCDTVAWMDCDVVLRRPGWALKAREMLKDVRLLQPFSRLYHLTTDTLPDANEKPSFSKCLDSVAYRFDRGDLPEEIYRTQGANMRLGYAPGMVWVASKELLQRHSFYDAAILGSGDKLIFASACGRRDDAAAAFRMNPRHREHFEAWAGPFFDDVRGSIAHVDGEAYHLWHGELSSRNYSTRYEGFEAFHFDPLTDIARNGDGVWCWNSGKPELHEFVRRLFERRRKGTSREPNQKLAGKVSSVAGE